MYRNPHPTMQAGRYTDGDAGNSIPATVLTAAGFNPLQEELVQIVESAGLVLDQNDETQVRQAIEVLIGRRAPRRNRLLNGGMSVWQRGESFAVAAAEAYTADRWCVRADAAGGNGTALVTRTEFSSGQTTVPGFPDAYLRHTQQVAASVSTPRIMQRIEHVGTTAAGVYTVSVWLKASTSIQVSIALTQDFGSGGSADVPAGSHNVTVTTAWQKFTHAFAVPSIAGKTVGDASFLEVALVLPGTGTYVLDVAQAQFELGNLASDFDTQPFADELARCERYYQQSAPYGFQGIPSYERGSVYANDSGNQAQVLASRFRCEMARVPAITWYSSSTGTKGKVWWQGADRTVTNQLSTSTSGTGYPEISGSIAGVDLVGAGWIAEAEL